jgi:hypothetical protein
MTTSGRLEIAPHGISSRHDRTTRGANRDQLATTLAHPATGICETSHCAWMDFCGFCASIVSVDDAAAVLPAGGHVGIARNVDEALMISVDAAVIGAGPSCKGVVTKAVAAIPGQGGRTIWCGLDLPVSAESRHLVAIAICVETASAPRLSMRRDTNKRRENSYADYQGSG